MAVQRLNEPHANFRGLGTAYDKCVRSDQRQQRDDGRYQQRYPEGCRSLPISLLQPMPGHAEDTQEIVEGHRRIHVPGEEEEGARPKPDTVGRSAACLGRRSRLLG